MRWTRRLRLTSAADADGEIVSSPGIEKNQKYSAFAVGQISGINLPDGQITQKSVQPTSNKYSARLVGQISDLTPRVSPNEGRLAIVTNVRWDAVDAMAANDECCCGGR